MAFFVVQHTVVMYVRIYSVHLCFLGDLNEISFNRQTFTPQAAKQVKGHFCHFPSLWIPIFLPVRYKWWIISGLLLHPLLFLRSEMQLPHCEDADEHGLHGAVIQRSGREPQGTVRDAAALGVKIEEVSALFDWLRAGRKRVVNVNMMTRRLSWPICSTKFHFSSRSVIETIKELRTA